MHVRVFAMDKWLRTGSLSANARSAEGVTSTGEASVPTDAAAEPAAKKARSVPDQPGSAKVRKYDPSYLQWGFVPTGDRGAPNAICVVCQTILGNSSLNPAKLQRHLKSKHPDYVDRPREFFERLSTALASSQRLLQQPSEASQRAEEVSFRISHLIGKAGEAHTIGEKLIKPSLLETSKCLFGEKEIKAVQRIPLSNDTVSRRIVDISSSLEQRTCEELRASSFWALQLDESVDVSGDAVLLTFVRYLFEGTVRESLLFCKTLRCSTTGEAIFELTDEYLTRHNIKWEKCVDVCTDGAAAMVGRHKGFVSRVREISSGITSSHCILHREALAAKQLPASLKTVLDEVIRVVNYIKSRPKQSRIFKVLCEEMGSVHTSLLLHTEVRWLSRGRVLTRIVELRSELLTFGTDQDFALLTKFEDPIWLQRTAYLADIFSKLNELSLSLQGRTTTVFIAEDKILAMKRKIECWISAIDRAESACCFESLQTFLEESDMALDPNVREDIVLHLKELRSNLERYFPQASMTGERLSWIRNPFLASPQHLSSQKADLLIDLQTSRSLQDEFRELPLIDFWSRMQREYPELALEALRTLVPFVTTYLCESAFSTYTAIKTKQRNRLDAEYDLRLQLSEVEPDFALLAKSHQYQRSH